MASTQYHGQIVHTLSVIPLGRVASYGQIADLAGLPGRARLVARVLKTADKQLALPWHRVLRSSGQIAFAPGSDEAMEQRARLLAEGVMVKGLRVDMAVYGWQPSLDEILTKLAY